MWTYQQTRATLSHDNSYAGTGYSGHGIGINNHAKEAVADVGPIPCGLWKIVRWDAQHADKGPCVGILEPVGHDAHGRSGFLIHGDNDKGNHSASHGCLILRHDLREFMRDSNDTDLVVCP